MQDQEAVDAAEDPLGGSDERIERLELSEAIEAAEREGGAMAERAANLKAVLQAPGEVAVLIAALCSEQAASISGQFFFVRGSEVGLFQPLSLVQTTSREAKWTAADLADAIVKLEPYPLDSPY